MTHERVSHRTIRKQTVLARQGRVGKHEEKRQIPVINDPKLGVQITHAFHSESG